MADISYTGMATTVTAAASALSQAAAGRRLPRQDTVRDYVHACRGTDDDLARAVQLWQAAARYSKGECTTEKPDPTNVHTPQQFTDAITALLNEAGLFGIRAIVNATHDIGCPLSRTTLSRWLNHSTAVMSTAMLNTLLSICDTPVLQHEVWKQARNRAALNAAGLRTPPAPKRKKKPVARPGQEGPVTEASTTRMLTVVPPLDQRQGPEPNWDVLVGELVDEDELVPNPVPDLGLDSPVFLIPMDNITSSRAATNVPTDYPEPKPRLSGSTSSLMNELRSLCRGQGVQAPGIDRQVGPALREVCGIGPTDGPDTVRIKLTRWVTGIVDQFPTELRLAVLTPLGLHEEAQSRFLNDRIDWLAKLHDRGARTIRRRIEAGLVRLVEAAVEPVAFADPESDWRLVEFDALLRLDCETPTCTERRTIRAERDGVDEITWSITLPKANENGTYGDLDVMTLHGVELISAERPSPRRFLMRLRLPRPLQAGETHQFALQVRVPKGQTMRPLYVFWPERGCDLFRLVARFPTDNLPTTLWRLDGEFHRELTSNEDRQMLEVNGIGEVEVSFVSPRPGYGYGIQWQQGGQGLPVAMPRRPAPLPLQNNAKAANGA